MALTREDEVVVGDPPVFERATTWSDWAFSVHVFLGATSFARVRRGVVSTDFGCGDWQPRGPASVGRCRRAGSAWLYGNRPRLRPGAEPLARPSLLLIRAAIKPDGHFNGLSPSKKVVFIS